MPGCRPGSSQTPERLASRCHRRRYTHWPQGESDGDAAMVALTMVAAPTPPESPVQLRPRLMAMAMVVAAVDLGIRCALLRGIMSLSAKREDRH